MEKKLSNRLLHVNVIQYDNTKLMIIKYLYLNFNDTVILTEILQDPAVASKLSDTKASGEVKALDDFYQMLQNDPNRAFYG